MLEDAPDKVMTSLDVVDRLHQHNGRCVESGEGCLELLIVRHDEETLTIEMPRVVLTLWYLLGLCIRAVRDAGFKPAE